MMQIEDTNIYKFFHVYLPALESAIRAIEAEDAETDLNKTVEPQMIAAPVISAPRKICEPIRRSPRISLPPVIKATPTRAAKPPKPSHRKPSPPTPDMLDEIAIPLYKSKAIQKIRQNLSETIYKTPKRATNPTGRTSLRLSEPVRRTPPRSCKKPMNYKI